MKPHLAVCGALVFLAACDLINPARSPGEKL